MLRTFNVTKLSTIFDIWIMSFLKRRVSLLCECQKGNVEITLLSTFQDLDHQFCEREEIMDCEFCEGKVRDVSSLF